MLKQSAILFITCLYCLPTIADEADFDWSAFDRVLKNHVQPGTYQGVQAQLVDYQQLKSSQAFADIAQALAQYNPAGLNRQQQLAFYINAYNYFAIKVVLDHWPVAGIKAIGNIFRPVWKRDVGTINGEAVTLDHIEHDILRSLGEPRIHFAIVCASMSCPDLRTEIYSADKLDRQLQSQVQNFLNNPSKGARIEDGELHLSKVFAWFEEDFETAGGVIEFVADYKAEFRDYEEFDTLDYNWALNRVRQ